jgi:protein-tyrosine phosphatase
MVAWRRVYRSGELPRMSQYDANRLKEEINVTTILDLRNPIDNQLRQETNFLTEIRARYYNVPFRPSATFMIETEKELYPSFKNMGEVYLYRVRHKDYGQRIVEALEIIADPENHPLVFHCAVGKDRSGVLAAILLSALGVADKNVIEDYTLTAPFMAGIFNRINNDPAVPDDIKNLPAYTWDATSESMALFLSSLKKEYGSADDYLKAQGADSSLVQRLEKALLV